MDDIDHFQDQDIFQQGSVLQNFNKILRKHNSACMKCKDCLPLQSAADRAPGPAVTPKRPVIIGHFEHCSCPVSD